MAPRVLSFAGLDPSGGAGILADVRVIANSGAEPLAVASCLTVQNSGGLSSAQPCPANLICESIQAVFEEGDIAAIKTGLILDVGSLEAFLSALDQSAFDGPLVVDPVLSVSAGGWAADEELLALIVDALLPRAAVVTPNLPEAARLGGGADPRSLIQAGARSVLLKDGHGSGLETVDRLYQADELREFPRARLELGPVHGTGCALSAALAAELALGRALDQAAEAAIDRVQAYLAATPQREDGRPINLNLSASS